MEYTKNLKLSKPSYDDDVDIQILNNNMDILDGKVGDLPYLPLKGGTVTGNVRMSNATMWFSNGNTKYDALIRVGTNGNFDIGAGNNTATGWATNQLLLHSYNKPKWYNSNNGGKELVADYGTSIGAFKGYTKLSNGLIMQWGFIEPVDISDVYHVTLSTPFSNANYAVFVNKSNGTNGKPSLRGEWWAATWNFTTTGFDVTSDQPSLGNKQFWFAIGG